MKLDNINDLEKLVFYDTKDENGNVINHAHLILKDGTNREISRTDGYDVIRQIAASLNIKTMAELDKYYENDNCLFEYMTENQYNIMYKSQITNDNIANSSLFTKMNKSAFDEEVNTSADLNDDNYTAEEIQEYDQEDYYDDEPGIFSRIADKIKKTSIGKKLTAFALIATIATGVYAISNRKSKVGQMTDSNIDYSASTTLKDVGIEENFSNITEYSKLLESTTNRHQYDVMKLMGENLDYYNITFADHYIESGKDVRANLTWDEMISLYAAYNEYSMSENADEVKAKIAAIFNGYVLDEKEFYDNYTQATLQLMGAYVLETRDAQVNSWQYITSTEGQEFVKKYNEMFLAAKEATGSQKVELVNKFYLELYKDFPISKEERTTGISHTQERESIKQYKLAITPIVAASEILFQNLEIDHTFSDVTIEFFDDLGLCNMASKQFDDMRSVLISSTTDYSSAKYSQFKSIKETELKSKGYYFVSDSRRDLSRLDAFKSIVNLQRECFDNISSNSTGYSSSSNSKSTSSNSSSNSSSGYTSSSSSSNTTYRTESSSYSTSSREEVISKAGITKVQEAEAEVNRSIEIENSYNKTQAEIEAEKNRQRLQQEADEESRKNQKIVKEDNKDLQDKINEVNNNINNGKTQNESDFGNHDVKIDDEYKDENGNIDKSVKDITTDSTGVKTTNNLPDPNKTGAEFDANAPKTDSTSNPTYIEEDYNPSTDPDCIDVTNNTNTTTTTTENKETESSSSNTITENTSTESSSSEENFYTEEVTTETTTTVETVVEEEIITNNSDKVSDIDTDVNTNTCTTKETETTSTVTEPVSTETKVTESTETKQTVIEYEIPTKTADEIVDEYLDSLELPSSDEIAKTLTK